MKTIKKYDNFINENLSKSSKKINESYLPKGAINISEFLGKVFTDVSIDNSNEVITFIENNGNKYEMYHDEDCCENVYIEDIDGDLNDLIGSPILRAEEVSNSNIEGTEDKELQENFTWTYYKLGTMKGSLTIRWFGTSNGCYSETAYIYKK